MNDIINRENQGYSIRFKIQGTLRGSLWMGGDAEKQINYTVKDGTHFVQNERETLREAVLRITNDGDFQGSNLLADSVLIVEMWKANNKRIIRAFELYNPALFPTIADSIIEDYPMFGFID